MSDSKQLALLSSNAMRGPLAVLAPQFERASGHTVSISYDPAQVMLRRIAAGDSGDVALLGVAAVEKLVAEGKIDGRSVRRIARCGGGIAVRAGARKPDVSTVEALNKTLLETPSLIFTSEGASGIHFSKVIEQLGIAEAIKAKARRQPGGLVAEVLARGEVELAVQQIPELMAVPGVELVGPLPEPVQATSSSAAAIFADTKNRTGAQALIDFLTAPEALRVFREKGHEPV
jgi:molybdate transport system substrate-binding protein